MRLRGCGISAITGHLQKNPCVVTATHAICNSDRFHARSAHGNVARICNFGAFGNCGEIQIFDFVVPDWIIAFDRARVSAILCFLVAGIVSGKCVEPPSKPLH